jgi:hypothetical protein
MIVKNVIGTLEVDPRSKTIWLNSLGRCVLRLSKLNFLDVNEKFSIIDGTPTGIYFHRDPEVEDSEKFMPNIISLVVSLISMVQENKIQDSKFFEEIERTISRMVNKSLEVKNMSILSDLLSELTSSDSDETLKKLCDKIYDQEVKHINHPTILPSGPNIFLALECPDDFQKYNFICLEREERNTFIVSHWGVMKDSEHPKRIRVWDCRGLPNNKIIEQFLEKYNFLRGK